MVGEASAGSLDPVASRLHLNVTGEVVVEGKARGDYLVLSSFSSSMSLREALTLLETSFP